MSTAKIDISKEAIEKYDSEGMYSTVLSMPGQITEAMERYGSLDLNLSVSGITNIILFGMGGSAIAGDIIKNYLSGSLNVPFYVNKNYTIPAFADKRSLLIFVSYSGNTEETLTSFEAGRDRTDHIVCLSSGGMLTKQAAERNIPVIPLPGGYQPRATIGFGITALLYLLYKLNLAGDPTDDLNESVKLLTAKSELYGIGNQDSANIPLHLAENTSGKIPVIYCTEPYFSIIGWRWKGQIAENAKALAFTNAYPELNHNEIVGWEDAHDFSDRYYLINLVDPVEHARNAARMAFTTSFIKEKTGGLTEVPLEGKSLLEKIFYAVYTGDMYSVYLAIANKVDPTPVESINKLKNHMSAI